MKNVGNIIGAIGLIAIVIISIYQNENQDELRNKYNCKVWYKLLEKGRYVCFSLKKKGILLFPPTLPFPCTFLTLDF